MTNSSLTKLTSKLHETTMDYSLGEAHVRSQMEFMGDLFKPAPGVSIEPVAIGDVPAERYSCSESGPVLLYFHGGGYVTGSAKSHRHVGSFLAAKLNGVVYSVEYRLAPETPFPGAVEDAITFYRGVRQRYKKSIAVAGDSAGGGLAFALTSKLKSADADLPDCIVGLSPWVNLETSNESYELLQGLDPILSADVANWHSERYLNKGDPRDPLASPINADLKSFPPCLIQIGDREVFFGDAVSMHQKLLQADVDSTLEVANGLFHVWHLYWPILEEGRSALERAAHFVLKHAA